MWRRDCKPFWFYLLDSLVSRECQYILVAISFYMLGWCHYYSRDCKSKARLISISLSVRENKIGG